MTLINPEEYKIQREAEAKEIATRLGLTFQYKGGRRYILSDGEKDTPVMGLGSLVDKLKHMEREKNEK